VALQGQINQIARDLTMTLRQLRDFAEDSAALMERARSRSPRRRLHRQRRVRLTRTTEGDPAPPTWDTTRGKSNERLHADQETIKPAWSASSSRARRKQRMHVWHPRLPRRDCFEHSATQSSLFSFTSRILRGVQKNQRSDIESWVPGGWPYAHQPQWSALGKGRQAQLSGRRVNVIDAGE